MTGNIIRYFLVHSLFVVPYRPCRGKFVIFCLSRLLTEKKIVFYHQKYAEGKTFYKMGRR